ncbi:hypothetical protein B0O80DRAFT_229222 [Mortierella sp. GBAus27b]|nr:hypothetical protein B0O80DRAFT_229222 [Mortierella sp. GBAus27b]
MRKYPQSFVTNHEHSYYIHPISHFRYRHKSGSVGRGGNNDHYCGYIQHCKDHSQLVQCMWYTGYADQSQPYHRLVGSSSDHKEPLDDYRLAFSLHMGISVVTKHVKDLPQQVPELPGAYMLFTLFIAATRVGVIRWILKLY